MAAGPAVSLLGQVPLLDALIARIVIRHRADLLLKSLFTEG